MQIKKYYHHAFRLNRFLKDTLPLIPNAGAHILTFCHHCSIKIWIDCKCFLQNLQCSHLYTANTANKPSINHLAQSFSLANTHLHDLTLLVHSAYVYMFISCQHYIQDSYSIYYRILTKPYKTCQLFLSEVMPLCNTRVCVCVCVKSGVIKTLPTELLLLTNVYDHTSYGV